MSGKYADFKNSNLENVEIELEGGVPRVLLDYWQDESFDFTSLSDENLFELLASTDIFIFPHLSFLCQKEIVSRAKEVVSPTKDKSDGVQFKNKLEKFLENYETFFYLRKVLDIMNLNH